MLSSIFCLCTMRIHVGAYARGKGTPKCRSRHGDNQNTMHRNQSWNNGAVKKFWPLLKHLKWRWCRFEVVLRCLQRYRVQRFSGEGSAGSKFGHLCEGSMLAGQSVVVCTSYLEEYWLHSTLSSPRRDYEERTSQRLAIPVWLVTVRGPFPYRAQYTRCLSG